MSTVTLTYEQLEELIGAVIQGVDMMEPYYSQCNADAELRDVVERYQKMLPRHEDVRPNPVCPVCHKRLRTPQGVASHLRDAHGFHDAAAKRVRKSLEPYTRIVLPTVATSKGGDAP